MGAVEAYFFLNLWNLKVSPDKGTERRDMKYAVEYCLGAMIYISYYTNIS
jgi:hypothetical protein